MSTRFGPYDDDDKLNGGLVRWLSDTMTVGTVRLFTQFLGVKEGSKCRS